MAFKDLREYIARLEAEGELQHITEEVDWNLEVGAIIRRCNDLGAPAPLFENITGYPKGFRILGTPAGPSGKHLYARIAISLGLSTDATASALIEEFARAKHLKPIKPKLVTTAPCKENIQTGDDIDLFKFPVPYLHQGDGGRYIGTWHINITRDPDTGWTNWGMYRLMLHDSKIIGGPLMPSQHIGMHFSKYEARGKPMPFAIAIGVEPVTTLIACAAVPGGVDEAGVVGAIRRQPVEVVKCETADLEVPATSEIVIEGEVLPYERREEGPFGEYSGYQTQARDKRPVYKVTAITHRRDPILTVVCPGTPIEDVHLSWGLTLSADILDGLRGLGYPVKMAFVPTSSGGHMAVISTETRYPGIAKRIANAVWGTKAGAMAPKIMVVDDDIDATNMNEVFWAFCTRNHPDKGIFKVTDATARPLWTFISPDEKRDMTTANVLFDCTWPKNWPADYVPRKASFDRLWPAEIQERVLTQWEKYGYKSGGTG